MLDKIMKSIDDKISAIESDPRYHYSDANVQINAPLALIQVDMKARMDVLKSLRKMIVGDTE